MVVLAILSLCIRLLRLRKPLNPLWSKKLKFGRVGPLKKASKAVPSRTLVRLKRRLSPPLFLKIRGAVKIFTQNSVKSAALKLSPRTAFPFSESTMRNMETEPYRLARLRGLLKKIQEELEEFGPERFWKGAGEREQKARESYTALFFTLALSKLTEREWWHLQRPDVMFPDFQIANFGGSMYEPEINIREFEQVTIPESCPDFETAYSIVRTKFTKYGPTGELPINLLIFVNHMKAESWTGQLVSKIGRYKPYREVWATYLLARNEEVFATRSIRLKPYYLEVTMEFSEGLNQNQAKLPDYFQIRDDGLYETKPEFARELKKEHYRKDFVIDFPIKSSC